jgi:hypothetical protein
VVWNFQLPTNLFAILTPDCDVIEARHSAPNDGVSWRRIMGPVEVAAEPCKPVDIEGQRRMARIGKRGLEAALRMTP